MYSQSGHYIRSMVKFTPHPVHPRGKSTLYRPSRRQGGPSAGQDVRLCRELNDSSLVQHVAQQLLCWLRHPTSHPRPHPPNCGVDLNKLYLRKVCCYFYYSTQSDLSCPFVLHQVSSVTVLLPAVTEMIQKCRRQTPALLLSSVLTIATARLDRSVTVKLGSIHVESDARRERTLTSDTSHAHIHRQTSACNSGISPVLLR